MKLNIDSLIFIVTHLIAEGNFIGFLYYHKNTVIMHSMTEMDFITKGFFTKDIPLMI